MAKASSPASTVSDSTTIGRSSVLTSLVRQKISSSDSQLW